MLSESTIRQQRRTLEADARGAARSGDYETWLRAIGGAVALDLVLDDQGPHATERIPFRARTRQASRRAAGTQAESVAELFERGRAIVARGIQQNRSAA